MGFISSSTTVTVQAKLTNAGKKKLYESIESQSGQFITRFALGDSDANYAAIEDGSGALVSGHVPETGDFKAKPRSFAIYQGAYRPGQPVVLVDGETGPEVSKILAIGANTPQTLIMEITTEWPKDESFAEDYHMSLEGPTSLSEDRVNELFTLISREGNVVELKYNGGANLTDIIKLTGNGAGESDFYVILIGVQTRSITRVAIRVTP